MVDADYTSHAYSETESSFAEIHRLSFDHESNLVKTPFSGMWDDHYRDMRQPTEDARLASYLGGVNFGLSCARQLPQLCSILIVSRLIPSFAVNFSGPAQRCCVPPLISAVR
jgi:hypothetical protein